MEDMGERVWMVVVVRPFAFHREMEKERVGNKLVECLKHKEKRRDLKEGGKDRH
jgi:hypothetical protein